MNVSSADLIYFIGLKQIAIEILEREKSILLKESLELKEKISKLEEKNASEKSSE